MCACAGGQSGTAKPIMNVLNNMLTSMRFCWGQVALTEAVRGGAQLLPAGKPNAVDRDARQEQPSPLSRAL